MIRGETEVTTDGDQKCKKPGVLTKLSSSDLHIPFGEDFDYFSLYLAEKAQQPHRAVLLHQYCKNICSAASSLVLELHCTAFVLLGCM